MTAPIGDSARGAESAVRLFRAITDAEDGLVRYESTLHRPGVDTPRLVVVDVWRADMGSGLPAAPREWTAPPEPGECLSRVLEFRRPELGASPAMHSTPTIDSGIIIAGGIQLHTPNRPPVNLSSGDCFVLRGEPHAWLNDSDEPCRMFVTMLGVGPLTGQT